MSYRSETIECIKKCLAAPQCQGSILHIEELLFRHKQDGEKVERFFTEDGTKLNSVDEIINLIDEGSAEFRRVKVSNERFHNSLAGSKVICRNIFINVTDTKGDQNVLCDFGFGLKNLAFVVSYWNDNDQDLKVKINYIDLVSAESK